MAVASLFCFVLFLLILSTYSSFKISHLFPAASASLGGIYYGARKLDWSFANVEVEIIASMRESFLPLANEVRQRMPDSTIPNIGLVRQLIARCKKIILKVL